MSEFSNLKMGKISGCLSHITKSNNCLQPIFEALINSVESYLEERERERDQDCIFCAKNGQ